MHFYIPDDVICIALMTAVHRAGSLLGLIL